jgi:hypothetical protein
MDLMLIITDNVAEVMKLFPNAVGLIAADCDKLEGAIPTNPYYTTIGDHAYKAADYWLRAGDPVMMLQFNPKDSPCFNTDTIQYIPMFLPGVVKNFPVWVQKLDKISLLKLEGRPAVTQVDVLAGWLDQQLTNAPYKVKLNTKKNVLEVTVKGALHTKLLTDTCFYFEPTRFIIDTLKFYKIAIKPRSTKFDY